MVKSAVLKGSLSGVFQSVVGFLLVLITIPIFVKKLGVEEYGLFSLISLVGSLNTFVNLGLNAALVRFLAEQGKTTESDRDIVVTFVLLLAITSPVVLCAVFFQKLILLSLFNVPPHLFGDGQWLFICMLSGNVLIVLGQTFTGILDSQQRVHLSNLLQVFHSIMYWGAILIVVILGFGLKSVAVVTLTATSLWFLTVAVTSLHAWGRLSLGNLRNDFWRTVRKQLAYGLQIYSGGLMYVLYEPLTKILVSHLIGVSEVGIYDIGLRVKNQVYGLATKILYPLFPMISKLSDKERIRQIIHDVEQKTFYLVLPFAAMIIISSKTLVTLFFRSHVQAISVTIAFIVPGYLIGSTTVTPMYQYLLAKGHAARTVLIQLINAVVNGLAIALLFSAFGYYAVVIGNTAALAASCTFLFYLQHKYLNSLVFDSIWHAFRVVATFLLALASGFIAMAFSGNGIASISIGSLAVIIVTITCYRLFELVSTSDVIRYLGENNIVSRMLIRVFCAPTSVLEHRDGGESSAFGSNQKN